MGVLYWKRGRRTTVAKTIRACIKNGRIEPLEAVELPEGTEVEVVIPAATTDLAAFRSSFGGWKGLIDADAFLADLRASRKLTRPEVRLS
jgi:predicted DNA-binding antitoxin AbrB/MazE fold protein